MIFLLGVILGVLLTLVLMIAVSRFHTPIERTMKEVENFVKVKGEVFIDSDEKKDFEEFIDNLPREL